MAHTEYGFPQGRWELSAAESQVLLTGAETPSSRVIKLALFELVVRRVFRLVTVRDRVLLFSRQRLVFVRDARAPDPANPALAAVVRNADASRRFADGTVGLTVSETTKCLLTAYRGTGGYVGGVVLPVLRQRGLFQQESYTLLGILSRTLWVITGGGIQALSELSALMDSGRGGLNTWIVEVPDRATAFVAAAGPALLLLDGIGTSMQALYDRLSNLRSESERASDRGFARPRETWFGFDAEQHAASSGDEPFSVSALAGLFGPEALDGLDAAYRAIDKEVDSALRRSSGNGDGE